jgi:hypothetical protein
MIDWRLLRYAFKGYWSTVAVVSPWRLKQKRNWKFDSAFWQRADGPFEVICIGTVGHLVQAVLTIIQKAVLLAGNAITCAFCCYRKLPPFFRWPSVMEQLFKVQFC